MFRQLRNNKRRVLIRSRLLFTTLALSLCSTGYSSSGASMFLATDWGGTLQIDEAPSGIIPSAQYTVRLSQGHSYISSFVYQVQNPGFLPNGQPSGISSSSTRSSEEQQSFHFGSRSSKPCANCSDC